ncbi:arginine deiminase-related protein [Rhizobium mesoamericanum]|uniref:Uncharacterized protein n=1 Tax=Rhizobium mesoamericanum STM3625 TaxID=1211777 RepID=K0PWW9_9HYPH|nr:arginine deiminase-related protein [Rhizobium mesoamericanum]CCM78278.1 hypothetical protein BN77_p10935 [Rhizobium mesoamericanum STM3625]
MVVLSASHSTLDQAQSQRSATLLPFDVSTIELAGGSVRCMLSGVRHGADGTSNLRTKERVTRTIQGPAALSGLDDSASIAAA